MSASWKAFDNYYKELAPMLTNNGLKDKPQSIFNADEIKTLYSKMKYHVPLQ